MPYFSAFWKLLFSHRFQWITLATLSRLTFYISSVLWDMMQRCVPLFYLLHHTVGIMETHFSKYIFLMLFIENVWSFALKISSYVSFLKFLFFNQFHDFLRIVSSIAFFNCPFSVFSYYFASCSILISSFAQCIQEYHNVKKNFCQHLFFE